MCKKLGRVVYTVNHYHSKVALLFSYEPAASQSLFHPEQSGLHCGRQETGNNQTWFALSQ